MNEFPEVDENVRVIEPPPTESTDTTETPPRNPHTVKETE